MITRALFWLTVSAAVVAAVPATFANTPATPATPAAPAAPAGRAGRGGPAVPNGLEAAMSEMNRMLQDIKKVAVDPAQADQALKDLATFERDVAICKLLVPPQITRMTDAKAKADALTSFRSMMTGLTKTALDLEDAVNDKKPDDVKKLIAQLEVIEKQGHTELKVGQD